MTTRAMGLDGVPEPAVVEADAPQLPLLPVDGPAMFPNGMASTFLPAAPLQYLDVTTFGNAGRQYINAENGRVYLQQPDGSYMLVSPL